MIVYDQSKRVYFVYAIDKIHAIRPAPNSKVQHHRFDEQKFMETRFGIWSSISDPKNPSGIYDVVVDVIDRDGKKYMLREFVDRKWHPSQKSEIIDEHTIRLSFRCGVSPELVSWVLRWAPHIRVVKPDFLKKEVRKRAEELMKML
jgi:predicted DNA-binding transcriptional regulator YafY